MPVGAPCLHAPKPSYRVVPVVVFLVANDGAKRRSGYPPRHVPMPSLNSTSRVRPVHGLREFRTGCAARVLVASVLVTCRCLAVVRVLGPAGLFY